LSKDILKKDTLGKITPLRIKTICKEKYLSQRWIPVLKGASGRIHALFEGMLKQIMTQI
jgi:hypothetical protein